jgi:hypothetical protein
MNKALGIQLLVYGLLLAGLSYFVHHLAPTVALPTLITGLVGGVLCLVWGVRAVMGHRGKALPLVTLVPVVFMMLSQSVLNWGGGNHEATGRRTAALVITLLFVLSMAMLMRIAYAGVVFDGQSVGSTKDGTAKAQTSGKTTIPANAGKRS